MSPRNRSAGTPLRSRSTWFVGASLLLAIVVMITLGSAGGSDAPLDPDNPNDDGARALARVLADQDVDVQVVRSRGALDRAAPDGGTTVLVTGAEALGRSTARDLAERADETLVVVAAPDLATTEALGVPEEPSPVRSARARAGCARWGLQADLRIDVDRALGYETTEGCFRGDRGHLLAQGQDGVLLLGAALLLENGQVTRADNAAVALRLLGQRPRLVWYVPTVDDLRGDDAVGMRTLLPDWIEPALLLGLLVAGATMLWRGRRLGPLEIEPLPVRVRAAESTHSLGRMYHRASDRAHAARVLRGAARARLAEQLRLPSSQPDEQLLRDVAAALGRRFDEVSRLLSPTAPDPTTDAELAQLAAELADITREVI